jgi:hypothetical protein
MTTTPSPAEQTPAEQTPAPHRTRRRLLIAAIVLVLLFALALTPPLLNVSRLRHRIATSMSQSLGRPVHLDNVTFHLLPLPGFTLQNLVISEDPAFGNEPVIRANEVEADLRISSLWRRQIEISTSRFKVDENGSGPSLNIVRNAQGRWNLEDIFMQAAHANTAPTGQRKAGPAPRFPYIEATGARVNLKLGDEKMPFSLTDADFALWLPEPQQWHVRLLAHPARTDTNATDTGEVRLEGTLGHAATLAEVPLNLTLSWAHAQMGETTRLLTGNDENWRGTLEAGATLVGPLAAAQLTTNLHVTDLRRADFVPTKLLDVSSHCAATANLTIVTLTQVTCTIPTAGPQPITVTSPTFDLQDPTSAAASVDMHAVPILWILDWANLFTQRIPASLNPAGTLDGTLTRPAGAQTAWTGSLSASLQSVTAEGRDFNFADNPILFDWRPSTAPNGLQLQLQPVIVHPGGTSQLAASASFDANAYSFHLTGTATSTQIAALGNAVLPPLGDELAQTAKPSATTTPEPVDIQCIRPFSGQQTCTTQHPPPTILKHRHKR